MTFGKQLSMVCYIEGETRKTFYFPDTSSADTSNFTLMGMYKNLDSDTVPTVLQVSELRVY